MKDQVLWEACNATSVSVTICVGQYIKNDPEKRENDSINGREN